MIAMVLDFCGGCGSCVDVCHPKAVFLSSGKALIDHMNCTICEKCIEACPTGALVVFPNVLPGNIEHSKTLDKLPAYPSKASLPQKGILVGTLLAWAGQHIMPHLVNVLANIIETEFATPRREGISTSIGTPQARAHRRHRRVQSRSKFHTG